ncbi:MAG: hypothetical protein ABEJ28_03415 [Salinigranum sp.]
MSQGDDGRFIGEQSVAETAFWGLVLLVPVAALIWEFGSDLVNEVHLTPNLPMHYIEHIDVIMHIMVIFLGGGTLLAFVYAAMRYSDALESAPEVMRDNWRQGTFIVWLAVIIAALGITGVFGASALMKTDSGPAQPASMDNHYNVSSELTYKVVGVQWTWMVAGGGAPTMQHRVIRMPANTLIHLKITSKDVIHSFAIQKLGVKKDAVPGQWNHYYMVVREPGTYQINCAALCGAGHSQMTPTLIVMPRKQYAQYMVDHGGKNPFKNVTVSNSSSSGKAIRRRNVTVSNATAGSADAPSGSVSATGGPTAGNAPAVRAGGVHRAG